MADKYNKQINTRQTHREKEKEKEERNVKFVEL
jgi:hypothetical protein